MSENERLYERANQAIHDLFSDSSVTAEKTKEKLTELVDEINMLIDSLGL
jgi:hypothetical protein